MTNTLEKKDLPFIQAAMRDEELMKDLAAAGSPEEIVKALGKKGVTISIEEAKEAFQCAHDPEYMEKLDIDDSELNDEDLENVVGGSLAVTLGALALLYVSGCAVAFLIGAGIESLPKATRAKLKKLLHL